MRGTSSHDKRTLRPKLHPVDPASMDARQGQVDELAFAMRERAAHEKLAQQPGRGEGQPMLPLPVSSGPCRCITPPSARPRACPAW